MSEGMRLITDGELIDDIGTTTSLISRRRRTRRKTAKRKTSKTRKRTTRRKRKTTKVRRAVRSAKRRVKSIGRKLVKFKDKRTGKMVKFFAKVKRRR